MSEKKQTKRQRKEELEAAKNWMLKKRRIALSVYCLFLIAAAIGTYGPWYMVYVKGSTPEETAKNLERPLIYDGDSYMKLSWVKTDDPANPQKQVENRVRPAVIALVGCIAGFFFASYNLVADTDMQIPILICSLVVAGTAGYVVYDIVANQKIIRDFVIEAEARRYGEALDASMNGVAPVHTNRPKALSIADKLTLRFKWGLALFASSSLVLLIESVYMTFLAQRTIAAEST